MRVEGGIGSGTGSGLDEVEILNSDVGEEPSAMPLPPLPFSLPSLPFLPLEAEHARPRGRSWRCISSGALE